MPKRVEEVYLIIPKDRDEHANEWLAVRTLDEALKFAQGLNDGGEIYYYTVDYEPPTPIFNAANLVATVTVTFDLYSGFEHPHRIRECRSLDEARITASTAEEPTVRRLVRTVPAPGVNLPDSTFMESRETLDSENT